MNFTHKQLSLFEEQKHTASEPLITDYMVRTLFLIDMEVRLLHLRLRYPQSGIVPEVKIESPLYLSKELTVTDLVELLYALHLIGAFRKKRRFTDRVLGRYPHFRRGAAYPDKELERFKNAAVNRKIRLTGFLDQLKAALTERSQR